MSLQGLSLIGFVKDERGAIGYLQRACVPPSGSNQSALRKQWQDATRQLGAPFPNAGTPTVESVPSQFDGYLGGVKSRREYAGAFKDKNWKFQMVEVAPLLAFQYHVLVDHSDNRCATVKDVPSIDEMIKLCLPQQPENYQIQTTVTDRSAVIKCSNLNVNIGARGVIEIDPRGPKPIGILVSGNLPFVEVSRFNGYCYLRNGYHRAYGLARRGATHIPCVLRDVASIDETGVKEDGSTLGSAIMHDANNRPTLGHFIQNRACAVAIRKMERIITVNWSECVVDDE